jgi:hypothetical protein
VIHAGYPQRAQPGRPRLGPTVDREAVEDTIVVSHITR